MNNIQQFLDNIEYLFNTNLQRHNPIAYESLKNLVAERDNFILSEVEREVEKKQEEYQLMKRQTPFQDTLFNHAVNVLEDISTIINNLRVK